METNQIAFAVRTNKTHRFSPSLLRCFQPLDKDPFRIPRSRYGPVSCFLASGTYNEDIVLNQGVYDTLREAGTFQYATSKLETSQLNCQLLLRFMCL